MITMENLIQLTTLVSIILGGGSIFTVVRMRGELEHLRATANKENAEAQNIIFNQAITLANYYKELYEGCLEESKQKGKHPR